jgi:hypothetical protein
VLDQPRQVWVQGRFTADELHHLHPERGVLVEHLQPVGGGHRAVRAGRPGFGVAVLAFQLASAGDLHLSEIDHERMPVELGFRVACRFAMWS